MTKRTRETLGYLLGLALATLLTLAAFGAVHWQVPTHRLILVVFGLGLVQAVVHFRCFLHVGFEKSSRDDLLLILFSTLIIALMAGGTLVLMANLHDRMM